MDWKDSTRSLSTRIWMTLQMDHWQIFWWSLCRAMYHRVTEGIILHFSSFMPQESQLAYLSVKVIFNMSFTEVWYILFAVLSDSDSSSSLEFVWWVYIAAQNHSISAVYSPSVCCHLFQLCMYNPPKVHTYSTYVTCTHISGTTNTWRTERIIYPTKSELC